MGTKIEWCDETWNPVTGCSPISEGCKNCYAARMANRLRGRCGYPADEPFRVTLHKDKINDPIARKKPGRIFVCSMGDLFHQSVPHSWVDQVMKRVNLCKRHTFMMLTKRPLNMKRYFFPGYRPPENLWTGTTLESDWHYDRAATILQIPSALRFLSVEPMLSEIDICPHLPQLGWVICGAETGPGARPMKAEWALDLYEQCKAAGVPFFFKKPGPHCDPAKVAHLPREFPEKEA